jgi:hypothetical protein
VLAVRDKHHDDEDHGPKAENNLDLTEKMPDSCVGGVAMRQLLEIFSRESVNQRNAKQHCADYLDGGRVQFVLFHRIKVGFCISISLGGRFREPFSCFIGIPGYPFPGKIHHPKVIFSIDIALISRLLK